MARRAQLEDDVKSLDRADSLGDLIGEDPGEVTLFLKFLVGELKGLAGNRLALMREMRELDDRLGLTPKGLAANRWKIVPDEEAQTDPTSPPGPRASTGKRRALKAVPAAG